MEHDMNAPVLDPAQDGRLRLIAAIDRFTETVGTIVSWLSIPLVGVVVLEVISRYFFNAPTVFAFDITYMAYGALFMMGAGPALLKGAHVRTDFFWDKFTPQRQGWIDVISYVLFFFPSFALLMLVGLQEAIYSLSINEISDQTPWGPRLWPFKFVLPLACLIMLIQGVSEFLKSLIKARTGLDVVEKEKVDV
jgi:TRAP-type mannitol/chloroaromatic compound transport system permease small subunit